MKGTFIITPFFSRGIINSVKFQTPSKKLTKLQAVVDNIESLKPSDIEVSDYTSIQMELDLQVKYFAKKPKGSFAINYRDLDVAKIGALLTEISSLSK